MSHTACYSPVRERVTTLGPWFTLLVAAGAVSTAFFASTAMDVRQVHVIGMVVAVSLASLAGTCSLIRKLRRPWTKVAAAITYILLTAGYALGAYALDSLDNPRRGAVETLITRLKSTGYYRYATAGPRAVAGSPMAPEDAVFSEATHRLYSCDAEEFPQGAATQFVVAITPFLARQGIQVRNVSDSIEIGGSYILIIDGIQHVLYYREEAMARDLGRLCVNRICGIVNSLLAGAHTNERLWIVWRGNFRYFLFLTEEQRGLLSPYVRIRESLD